MTEPLIVDGPHASPPGPDGLTRIELVAADWSAALLVLKHIDKLKLGHAEIQAPVREAASNGARTGPRRIVPPATIPTVYHTVRAAADASGRMPAKPHLEELARRSGPRGTGPLDIDQILEQVTKLGWKHKSKTPKASIRRALNAPHGAAWVKSSGGKRARKWSFLPLVEARP